MTNSTKYKQFTKGEKVFFWGLIIWIFLQVSRFIALVLIEDINNGAASTAWMYPAYLDIFAAALAAPLILAIIRWRGLLTWTAVVVYLAISIVDHFGNFTNTNLVGAPSIVEEGSNPYLIPVIQTVFDFIFLILLLLPKYYNLFFEINNDKKISILK